MTFYFNVHPTREEAHRLHERLSKCIERLGGIITDDPKKCDFSVAIGGDGTVVSAWRKSAYYRHKRGSIGLPDPRRAGAR